MKSLSSPFHDNLYPTQWIISRWSIFPIGWKVILTLLIGFNSIPSNVDSRDVDYYYHRRVYRQNVLPNLRETQEQPLVVEPSLDDYTVDNNYEKTQFKLRSSDDGDDGTDNLISRLGIGKDNGYAYGLDDTYLASLKALNTDSSDDFNRQSQHQQPQADDQHGALSVSSFVKDTPKPSSQLKAPSFHVDSSPPIKMFARASASASASSRIHGGEEESAENLLFVGSVIGVTFVGIFLVIATGYFVHRINIQRKAAADVEYPAYGVVGPGASLKDKESSGKSVSGTSKGSASGTVTGPGSLSPSGDRRLAQSAQMYHYHHQKQQMISSDKVATEAGQGPSTSEMDSEEEENEEGDYTVYECPGLASTGEMEVKNPLFQDDITPISSPLVRDAKHDGPIN